MHSFAAGLLLVYKLYFCVMFTLNWACAKSVLGMCRHNWPCLWQIWWMTMTIWYVFGWLKLRLNSGFVLKLRHRLDRVTHFCELDSTLYSQTCIPALNSSCVGMQVCVSTLLYFFFLRDLRKYEVTWKNLGQFYHAIHFVCKKQLEFKRFSVTRSPHHIDLYCLVNLLNTIIRT